MNYFRIKKVMGILNNEYFFKKEYGNKEIIKNKRVRE